MCHGGEATCLPFVKECIGYSQLDATLKLPDTSTACPSHPFDSSRLAIVVVVSVLYRDHDDQADEEEEKEEDNEQAAV